MGQIDRQTNRQTDRQTLDCLMADHVTIYEKELQRKINEHKESEKSPIVSKAAEIKCTDLQTVTKKHECAVSNCVVNMCIIRHCENV